MQCEKMLCMVVQPPLPARIGNLVFYISIQLSPWVSEIVYKIKKCFESLLFDSDLF